MSEQRFVVGQKIECMDGNNQKWYHARIKDVKPDKVLVQWSNPRWQHSKYDQWIIKAHYDLRIRPRKNQKHNNDNSGVFSPMKHIDDWTHDELCQWMCSLNGVSSRNQKKIMKSIMTDRISGRDFNTSVENISDVRQSFPDISDNGVHNVYIGLQQLRTTQYQYNIQPTISYDDNDQQREDEIKQSENQKTDNTDSDAIITDLLNKIETQNNVIETLKQKENEEYIKAKCIINTITQEKENLKKRKSEELHSKNNKLQHENEQLKKQLIALKKQNMIENETLRENNQRLTKELVQLKTDINNFSNKNQIVVKHETYETYKNKNVSNWNNKDLLDWIKTIGLMAQWQEIMITIIESSECVGNDWCMCKNFKEFAKKFNIQQTMLANRVFREFKKMKQKNIDIDAYDEHNSGNRMKRSIPPAKPVVKHIWDMKHINEWTCDILKQWIKSLHLNKRDERKVIESITEQEVSGLEFNSIEEAVDLMDAFEVNNDCAMKIFSALDKVRAARNSNNT